MSHDIADVFQVGAIDLEFDETGATDKAATMQVMASLLAASGAVDDPDTFLSDLQERDAEGPTYMGNGIAIPHARSTAVQKPAIGFARSDAGVAWDDGGTADLVFVLAVPQSQGEDVHMRVLAHLARLLVHEEFRDSLRCARQPQDIIQAVRDGQSLLA